MGRIDRRSRPAGWGPRRRNARPGVEGLEGRLLLYATTGNAWSHPTLITYSVVADGTNVGGYASNLFQAFDAKWSPATWLNVFSQAAAVWEQVANVNIIPWGDDGVPIGSGPDQQGDPNHGDIRISGVTSAALGAGVLGETFFPPPSNGNSIAGDIMFNTSQPWQINNGSYDLLTVAIHEFGHALGMDHSAIATADMYAAFNGVKQTLTPDDIAGVQSIYGARQPDLLMAQSHNTSPSAAVDLTPAMNTYGQISLAGLDIQNSSTTEWYKVTAPASTKGSMVVTMQSTNQSMLSPLVEVFNSSLQYIGYAYASGAFGATVSTTIPGVAPGLVYYIAAAAANGGATGAGNYGLQLNFGNTPLGAVPTPMVTIANQPSLGGGRPGRRGQQPRRRERTRTRTRPRQRRRRLGSDLGLVR